MSQIQIQDGSIILSNPTFGKQVHLRECICCCKCRNDTTKQKPKSGVLTFDAPLLENRWEEDKVLYNNAFITITMKRVYAKYDLTCFNGTHVFNPRRFNNAADGCTYVENAQYFPLNTTTKVPLTGKYTRRFEIDYTYYDKTTGVTDLYESTMVEYYDPYLFSHPDDEIPRLRSEQGSNGVDYVFKKNGTVTSTFPSGMPFGTFGGSSLSWGFRTYCHFASGGSFVAPSVMNGPNLNEIPSFATMSYSTKQCQEDRERITLIVIIEAFVSELFSPVKYWYNYKTQQYVNYQWLLYYNPPAGDTLVTESGDTRLTESGDIRIIE